MQKGFKIEMVFKDKQHCKYFLQETSEQLEDVKIMPNKAVEELSQ